MRSCVTALARRKGAYLPGAGILAPGALSPEQACVTISSVAFAGFVKFFADYLAAARAGRRDAAFETAFEIAVAHLPPPPTVVPRLRQSPRWLR